jgi:hypothetical protein
MKFILTPINPLNYLKTFQCLLTCSLALINLNSYPQRVFYSGTDVDKSASNFNVIGQVKNHIVVWEMNSTGDANSKVIIYDNRMHLINKVQTDILNKGNLLKFDFINCADSFQLIHQYISKKKYFCKRYIFDENGNLKNTDEIENASTENSWNAFNILSYQVLSSGNKQNFALLRAQQDTQKNVLEIDYKFFGYNKQTSNTQIVPYSFQNNIPDILLDDDNLLFLIGNNTVQNNRVSVYQINLLNNTIQNSIRDLQDGFLIGKITLATGLNRYLIYAEWKKDLDKQENGIFLWQLNKDLSDAKTDTVIKVSNQSYINEVNYFNLQSFFVNNDIHLFLFPGNYAIREFHSQPATSPALSAPLTQASLFSKPSGGVTNPFNGFVTALNSSATGELYGSNVNSSYNSPGNSATYFTQEPKPNFKNAKLISLKLDTSINVENFKTFTSKIEPDLISEINEAKVFESNSGFNILFPQEVSQKIKGLGYINLKSNYEFTYNRITLMHFKYELMLNGCVQLNKNAIIVPALTPSNHFVFLKIEFE